MYSVVWDVSSRFLTFPRQRWGGLLFTLYVRLYLLLPTHTHYILPNKGVDPWTQHRIHCGKSIRHTRQAVELGLLYVRMILVLGHMIDIIQPNRFQYHRMGDCRYPCSIPAPYKHTSAR